ncbi:hypothetical protein SLS62_003856 [Diatrype stigma]|uniref:Uncharacterized protein n=1 Tax=Diatrype stigma TaxID=117547 RepID=A0AAN9YTQ7_9PEZI
MLGRGNVHHLPSAMLSSAETIVPSLASEATMATTSTTLYFDPMSDQPASSSTTPRSFKQHKPLPHPKKTKGERPPATITDPQPRSLTGSVGNAPSLKHVPSSQSSASLAREYEEPSMRNPGPDLPPTPPTHSRSSSGSHSIVPSSLTHVASPMQTPANTASKTPGTPPNQRSPPTPDVTPPKAERRPKAIRPRLTDRLSSKATTADSRTASFFTAREDPSSEEDERSTVRTTLDHRRTGSQSTVRAAVDSDRKSQDVGLGLGLESEENSPPRSKQEFFTFDGEWSSPSKVEQVWDGNLHRNVEVRKQRVRPETNRQRREVIDDVIVLPTNATKAVRSMPLQEPVQEHHSTKESVDRARRWLEPSNSESSINADARRSSGMSSKSTVSTVVEAVLIETQPRRQKTLRHVKKRMGLRDFNSEVSGSSSASNSLAQADVTRRPRVAGRVNDNRTDSQVSTGTVNSVSSHKARREVWKNGGIPVVIIPDRKTSIKPTKAPSHRSTNIQQSRRSNSLSSAPFSRQSKSKDLTPLFNRPSRRGRAMSESDGSYILDELTMDYPPIAPLRRSSLSAPTSRNGSRASSRGGSLTSESLKAHDALQQQQQHGQREEKQRRDRRRQRDPEQEQEPRRPAPQVTVERVPSFEYTRELPDPNQLEPVASAESHRDVHESNRSLVDHNGDPFFDKRLSMHNTPFSQASVETNGTHSVADISEAMAVSIYPHQNRSVLMVHHLSKTPGSANALDRNSLVQTEEPAEPSDTRNTPEITARSPGGGPVTPPRPQMSMDDVDSPLRNPRAPPVPPAIQFIPATPSGLTPAAEKEKMLGNYFEETQKRPSLVRRAFSLRKSSDASLPRAPGFLTRTLSHSRNVRKEMAANSSLGKGKGAATSQWSPADDESLPDETKLHPYWRPASQIDVDADDDYVYDVPDENNKIYRYPPMDNGPNTPRRSLSSRMRNTFAILPVQNDDHYTADGQRSPERRTIKRSPSGHLRVMRSRSSYSSVRWSNSHSRESEDGRPSTAPDRSNRRAWGVEKRVDSQGRRVFAGWQDKVQQYGINNLQRRFSEHRRQKRTQELRQKISGPREVRDGVGEVIKRNSYKGPSYQGGVSGRTPTNDTSSTRRRASIAY